MRVGIRRPLLASLVSLCASVGGLVFASAPALAAAPEAPGPVVVESVKAGEATLLGVLNPGKEGAAGTYELGTYEFLYAKSSTTCEGESRAPESPGISLGGGMEGVSQSVSGLEAGTEYTVCLLARNGLKGETMVGPAEHFTTAFSFVEAPEAKPANPIAATEATLHGVLNPKSERTAEPGSAEFVYRQSTTECQRENPETGQKENENTASAEKTPEGHEGEAAEAKVSELSPGATHTFCLRVVNKAGEEQVSPPETFTTLTVPLTISGESVTEDSATAAKLNAQVDPGGAETTYHFEYDTSPYTTSAPHGQRTPESPSVGADNSLHPATAAIQGLQPGTTYHYRLVATNPKSPPGGTDGSDATFTTETTGGEFALPDGRAYELVSPPQKDAGEVLGIGGEGHTLSYGGATQASGDGTSVTYMVTAPVGASPPGNILSPQMFSTRGAGGWSSKDISTPHVHSIGPDNVGDGGEEYLRFSPDLSRAVLLPLYQTSEPSLAPEVHQEVAGGQEIYLRDNATGSFQALLTKEPLPPPRVPSEGQVVKFEGATPGLDHVVFEGPVGLDPHYPHGGSLYEWSNGQAQLVDVLPPPNSEPAVSMSLLGGVETGRFGIIDQGGAVTERHAISDDGTRVVWSGEGGLFMRDMATGSTVQVDVVQGGGGTSGGGSFLGASSDGSRVFFTDGNELISGAHEDGLYMFEPERKEGERLTDLTPGMKGAQAQHLIGANDAGTSLYVFTSAVIPSTPNSEKVAATLCPEVTNPVTGYGSIPNPCNLYLLREAPAGSGNWSTTFITGGAEEGSVEPGNCTVCAPLIGQTARVSPNGGFLAFMSQESLTGYDNRDANSGQPDEEVYLYDAEADKLVCASCDPTGARPVGELSGSVPGYPGIFLPGQVPLDPWSMWDEHWLAASIPGWTPDGSHNSTGYQPRYLNDSGRLFFDSVDALVPRDVNGRDDVYEYEPVGVGGCRPPSYGQGASVVFNRTLGGCIALISAGTGNSDSVFFDASASGNDVFFVTPDGLVQSDRDGVGDMYDARVCTQAEPCSSSFAVSPACTTTDSCRVAPSPQPGIFGAPATATFVGAGNVTPIPSATKKAAKKKTVKCIKGKKRSRGRCVKAMRKRTKAKKAGNDRRPGR